MKIPLHLPPCEVCNKDQYVWISVSKNSFKYECDCGNNRSGYLGSSITVGYKLLYRSDFEFRHNKDYPLSIIFSASAFEWEIVRLYKKWFHITKLREGNEISIDELNDIFLKHQKIVDKIKKTGKLLYPKGFKEFVSDTEELKESINNGFKSLNIETIVKDLEKNLFWPRNRIIHSSFTNYGRDDAVKIHSISRLGLFILHTLDEYKRNEK